PTKSHSARTSPTPGTVFLRVRARPQATHASTSAAKLPQSRFAMRTTRASLCAGSTVGGGAEGAGSRATNAESAASPGKSRKRHAGPRPSSLRISSLVGIALGRARVSGRGAEGTPHDNRVFTRTIGRRAWIVVDAAGHGCESFRLVQPDRSDVRRANFEEHLLDVEVPRILDEESQERASDPFAPRVRHHREI